VNEQAREISKLTGSDELKGVLFEMRLNFQVSRI
jgi:hypothetical protein